MLIRKKGNAKPIDLTINYSFLLDTWHGLFKNDFLYGEYMENLMAFLYLSYEDRESGIMPNNKADIFKPFQKTSYDDCNVVFITEFPTTTSNSSGLGLGNKAHSMPYMLTKEFTQFKNVVEATLYEGRFKLDLDPSLEESSENGILYLNSALTCHKNDNKAHVNHWEKFIRYFLKAYDDVTGNKLFVLIGEACKFADCIDDEYNTVLLEPKGIDEACENGEYWNSDVLKKTNDWLIENYGLPYSEKTPFI
jgi:uracil DNA glycosylase